jgi:hypothetical protein
MDLPSRLAADAFRNAMLHCQKAILGTLLMASLDMAQKPYRGGRIASTFRSQRPMYFCHF